MSKKIKLISLIDVPQRYHCTKRTSYGLKFTDTLFEPNQVYELPDDEVYVTSLLNNKCKQQYSDTLAKRLTEQNIPFETKVCRPCGGRRKDILYSPFEVFE